MIEQVCDDHERKTGQAVARQVGDLPADAPEPVKIALYRVLQGSLSNAFRHGGAGRVWVRASASGASLTFECSDDGPGIRSNGSRGLGLRSMRERVELLDGSFHVAALPSGGTTVRATIPMDRCRSAGV